LSVSKSLLSLIYSQMSFDTWVNDRTRHVP
jgi:hypothetical protein